MNKERMQNLLRVLEEVRDKHKPLNMRWWFSSDGTITDNKCGTAACALGWACRDPWMQEQGLSSFGAEPMFESQKDSYSYGIEAAQEFFELSHLEAAYIFLWDYYYSSKNPTISDVIARVQGIIS